MTGEVENICAWPDGTWCAQDELEDYGHMSDDYTSYFVPVEWDYETIDAFVCKMVGVTC